MTRRGTLLMETGLLHDYFGNFSTWGERYYITWCEVEPTQGEIEMNIAKLGKLGKTQISFSGGGTGDGIPDNGMRLHTRGGVPDMGMGFQTWGWGSSQGWGSRHGDGVPDMGMGFLTWGWGSRHGDGVPDKGWGSRHGDGVPRPGVGFLTWGWGTRHRWGSRYGMMGYQTDDGVPVRGGVTTFTSHQSGILHSLIFDLFNS